MLKTEVKQLYFVIKDVFWYVSMTNLRDLLFKFYQNVNP